MTRRLFFWILLLPAMTACRKKTAPAPPPAEKYELITTASLFNDQTGRMEPYYWKGSAIHPLPFTGARHAYSIGIKEHRNSVLIAGLYEPDSGPYAALPCYWRNGVFTPLPVNNVPGPFEKCHAKDVEAYNDHIYILGAADQQPLLWEIAPGGQVTLIPIPPEKNTLPGGMRSSSNCSLYNGQLYIGGDQVNTAHAFQAGYWQVDLLNKNITWHSAEQGLGRATAFCIHAGPGGVYITGEKAARAGDFPRIAMWKDHAPLPVPFAGDGRNLRMAGIWGGEDGHLYANILDFNTYMPLIWQLREDRLVRQTHPVIPSSAQGFCHLIALHNVQTAYIGKYRLNQEYHLWAEVGNRPIELEMPFRKIDPLMGGAAWVRKGIF